MRGTSPKIKNLYIHIPFCDGKCGYCAFYSTAYDSSLADRFLEALAQEIILVTQEVKRPLLADTIYIGGGTPSTLSAAQLERLGTILQPFLAADARPMEWTVEMNPGTVTAAKLAALVHHGVNRISLGAQAFDDDVLRFLGRRHSVADIFQSFRNIRKSGLNNIGLDLIAGVPLSAGAEKWQCSLEQAQALNPKHISVYALTAEEGSRLSQAIDQGSISLLSDTDQLAALDSAEAVLTAAGYRRYEISNYAQAGFECRMHCAYWQGEEYLGFGPGAASHVGLLRWTNQPDLECYLQTLNQNSLPQRQRDPLTPALKIQERIIFGLRMATGISAALAENYQGALRRLAQAGLLKNNSQKRWILTARGRQLADYVAVELMAGPDPAPPLSRLDQSSPTDQIIIS